MNAATGTNERHGNRDLVIGVGNIYRSDDGIGVLVARRIRKLRDDLNVIEASGEGAELMEAWKQANRVVLIDAVRSSASAGYVHRLDAVAKRVSSGFFNYSTHAFSVAEAVEMSRALDQLPLRLIIYGIEGKSFFAGQHLSPCVATVVEDVVQRVLAEFDAPTGATLVEEVAHA